MSGLAVVVDVIQGAFSYSGKQHPPGSGCVPESSFYMDQGGVFIKFTNTTPAFWSHVAKRPVSQNSVEHEDHEDYKRFFMFRKLLDIERQQFRLIWHQLCQIRQSQLDQARQLLRMDATMGLRALIGKENVHAKWAGEALVFWECRNVTASVIHVSGSFKGKCYEYTPVQLQPDGKLWFVSPGSNDLVESSPTVNCAESVNHYFQGDDGAWYSVHGPVHITELPIELVWKGLWSAFHFSAPSLFLTNYPRFSFTEHTYQIQRLLRVERKLDHLINFTAEMSMNPSAVFYALTETADFVGHAVSGVISGVGGLIHSILIGPIQFLINLVVIASAVLCAFLLLFKLIQCQLQKKNQIKSVRKVPQFAGFLKKKNKNSEFIEDEEIKHFHHFGEREKQTTAFEELNELQSYQPRFENI